jgi:YHYH protein
MTQPVITRRRFLTLAGGAGAAAASIGFLSARGGSVAHSVASPTLVRSKSLPTGGFDTSHLGNFSNDRLTMIVSGDTRTMYSQSMPAYHPTDPDYSYVAPPTAQKLTFRVTTKPRLAPHLTELVTGYTLGVHLDSVTLETATANYYGQFLGPWNEVPGKMDRYGAHTHPIFTDVSEGDYHYHRPTDEWESSSSRHSPIVGWAADGFPVYLRYGYAEPSSPGSVKYLLSSFRVRSGDRPSGSSSPGGKYDGTYVADYEYVPGLGDLDQSNGRLCVTPEFPDGIYAYFLTDQWPWIPHWLRGAPDRTFTPQDNGSQGPPSGGAGAPSGGPGGNANGYGGAPGGQGESGSSYN